MKLEPWKIIKSTIVFDNKWYRLRQDEVSLPDGSIIDDYFVSVRPEVVLIFPVTTEGKVLLVKQYKHGIGKIVIELPGGAYDPATEVAIEAAERELIEETGYAGNLEKVAEFFDNPTKDTNSIKVYLARNCRKVQEQHLDPTENIEVMEVGQDELKLMVRDGIIKVSGSVAAISVCQNLLQI